MNKSMIITMIMLLATGCGPKSEPSKAPPVGKKNAGQKTESNSPKTEVESAPKGDAEKTDQPKTIVLDRSRTYQLDVESILPDVSLLYLKRWTFEKEFPGKLLAEIKKHPKFEVPGDDFFGAQDHDAKEDRGHVFWKPEGDGKQISAALLYVVSEKRKVLDVSFEIGLDHSLAKDDEARDAAFDSLSANIDLAKSAISNIRWGEDALPGSESDAVATEEFLQVSFIGQLTAESSQRINAANRLLAEEMTQRFREIAQMSLANDSHHGISLGWMSNQDLDHNLMVLPGTDDEPASFRYRVGGKPFSLDLVRNQLAADGWPMVLRGQEYVGATEGSTYILRPIEIILSRSVTTQD